MSDPETKDAAVGAVCLAIARRDAAWKTNERSCHESRSLVSSRQAMLSDPDPVLDEAMVRTGLDMERDWQQNYRACIQAELDLHQACRDLAKALQA